MNVSRAIVANAFVTVIGLALDIYGILNLNVKVALAGLIVGLADMALFLWLIKRKVYK